MARARLDKAGASLVASLLLVLTAATGVHGACNAICKRDVARCVATQCAGVGRETCRRRCKPAAIRTLAYVMTECREDAAGMVVAHQELRIRRGDREPITVAEFGPGEPVPNPRFCRTYGALREGADSVRVFALQRLGVSPDGSAVVFEVNDLFSISPHTPLSPEQRGFFMVRSDGRGLRPLGPASRARSFSDDTSPPIAFSPNGRRIAFTDLGPGPGGEEAVQIVVLDLATGKRTQVTRLPSGTPPSPPDPVYGGSFFLTCCPQFIDDETVVFQTYVDPDGSNPEHTFAGFTVRIDGSGLKPVPIPVSVPGSRVVPSFAVGGGRGTSLLRLSLPGTPVKHRPFGDFPITEVFVRDGENLHQLTNFRCQDTVAAFLNATRTRAFFLASADPLGTNPNQNCQLFSIGVLGGANSLRQVTHFASPSRTIGPACAGVGSAFPGCPIGSGYYRVVLQDPVTKAIVFDSTCDPFHANLFGGQLFAMRPDGTGLRQLTDAAGFTTNPDGSFRVELPGPFAYSTAYRR
jgi:hypothetical protein